MKITGQIIKMRAGLNDPVEYQLPIGDERIDMNALIGKRITLKYNKEIRCISCGRRTKTSFAQGFCYTCFINSPEASECIIRPELCQAHNGIGRDMEWERKHHLQEHFVYLALTSGVKVGVTRSTQVPTRWIDQGASEAILLAKTPNRYLAGCIEVCLKKHVSDKTQWQRMLVETRNVETPLMTSLHSVSLVNEKSKMLILLPDELREYLSEDNIITAIKYPVIKYPEKVKSVNFDKLPEISGILNGIKGQYLLLDNDRVLNIRRHTGYVISVEF